MVLNLRLTKFLIFFSITLIFLSLPTAAFSQEKISQFNVNLTAHQDGSMSIKEEIIYDFGDSDRHGIYRYVPLVSRVGDLYRVIRIDFGDIKRDDQVEPFEVDRESKQTSVKIGDADKTISGVHKYDISYSVQNGIGSNYEAHDEIYWNVTGNEWEVPIEKASLFIKTDFGAFPGETICFTGSLGSREANCSVSDTDGEKKVTLTKALNPSEGLTIVTKFPVNTFPKSILQKDDPFWDPDFLTNLKFIISVYFFLNFILAPYLIYWYFTKKNKKSFGPPAVNFDLPEGPSKSRVTPAEAGTIDNAKLDKDDIIATIFDLAIRKYLKIEQVKKKGKFLGLGESNDYQLVKLKDFSDLNDFENSLLKYLFKDNAKVSIKETSLSYTEFDNLEKKNFKTLINKGFYVKNPKTQMGLLLTFGIISLATLNLVLGSVLIWLSRKLNGRTQLGDQTDFKTDGLKLFLKNMKRYYKWQAESGYFVEKYIPYAMALGFIDQYMDQLKVLNPNYKPNWYSGSNFYTNYALFGSSFSSNITTSAPSSSSGFSGGSSGGGGGGGGGGSW